MARSLTIALAGDVMLGRLVDGVIREKGFAHPWGDVLPILRRVDLFLVNLECVLTTESSPWHDGKYKAFYFRADPSVAGTLKLGRVDFASLANNHIADFGAAGLLETLAVLDRSGIAHAGAGPDRAAARKPAYLRINNRRIAVIAFADYPRVWAASSTSPGLNWTPISLADGDFTEVESALAASRQHADFVIFSIHWGPNMRSRPSKLFRQFAHRVLAAGADIFWGHSAHLVQGVEIWNGKIILYDAGDFVDDYAVDEKLRNDLSALFLVKVRPPVIESLELLPVKIDNMQVNQAQGREREWFVRRFSALCEEIGTKVTTGAERLSIAIPARGTSSSGRATEPLIMS